MKHVQRIAVALALLFVCGLLISAVIPSVPSGTWQATGDMAAPRTGATATVFPDGRLMIVGGTDATGEPLATAEFYNADGSVSAAPSMSVARSGHAAIFLYDGRLLVTGGRVSGGGTTNSAEVFDPLTNHWQTLDTALLNARAGHTLSQLQDGSVLIAGGEDSSGPVSALEVFDLYNNFNAAGSLATARKDHAAAVLPDGRVLIAGGTGYAADSSIVTLNSTEIYDPATNSVTAGPAMSVARAKHSATTLLDGRVLIAGGNDGSNDLASAEVYNPTTGAITATDSMAAPRSGHTALLLPNNNAVLIAGGTSAGNDVATAELYESWNNAFKSTGSMTAARTSAAASAPAYDGLAMLAGGSNLASTELYGFATVKTDWNDYSPGQIVTITGSGWKPGESVTLTLVESPLMDVHAPMTVVADASGNIFNNDFVPDEHDLNVRFYLLAVGKESASHAYNSFTDSRTITSATITANSVTVPPASSVTVSGGASISATVNVTTDNAGGNQNWRSTGWRISTTAPGAVNCVDHSNHDGSGTYSETLSITAPSGNGTYNVYFVAYSNETCTQQPSVQYVLTGAVTVNNPVNTTTTITSESPDPSVVGQAVTVNYSVTAASGTPTGSVTVSDGSNSCTGTVAAGNCSITFTSPGAKSLTASYAGDTGFNSSTSVAVSHQVNKGETTTSITSDLPDPSIIGQSVTVNYSVSPSSPATGTPTGNVTVSDGVNSCTGTVAAGTCNITLTTAGSRTLTATYAGDTNFNGITSAGEPHTVGKITTTTSITADTPDPSVVGESVTVQYSVNHSGSGTPTGNVTVSDGTVSCTGTVAAGSCSLTFTSTGTKSLTATYAGDSTFDGSTSAAASHQVNKADTTTTISSDTPDPSVVGQSVTVNFGVAVNSPGSGIPTGNVTVSDGTTSCTATVAVGTCSITFNTAGAKTLTATYAGDSEFNGSASAGASHQVDKGNTTTSITSDTPDPSVVGQAVTVNYTVAAAAPASGIPTGSVTVSDGTSSCTGTVAAGQCAITFTSAGAKTLTATYAGDSNFNGSTSASEGHTVNKADTTTTITSDSPDPSVFGQSVTVHFSLSVNAPGSGTPTGNVTVSDGTQSCTATVATGQCSLTFNSVGAKTLTATYAGDSNFNGSTSAGEPHTVNKGDTTTTITNDNPDPSVVGQSVTVDFTVVAAAPAVGTPTGNVTVSDGSISCTAPVSAGGCSLTFTSAGARTLTATYAGDDNFNGSSDTESHVVNKADTTTTITSDNPDPSVVGESITVNYNVVVVAPGIGTPAGNVTVTDGTNSCTGTVAAGTCTLTLTTAGAKTLTASYAGDSNFNSSISSGTAHQVDKGDTATTITSDNPDPSVVGQPVTVNYSLAVTAPASGTPTGNVTVSDGTNSCTGTVAAGSCYITFTSAGAKSLTATYAGDSNFNGSTSASAPHTVNKADTTTTITAHTPDPSVYGQAVTVNFGVAVNAPGAGTPTGNVTVSDGVNSCTGTVAAGTCLITLTTVGSRTLTATYGGDTNFNGSTSAGAAHTVNKANTTTTITSDAPDASVLGQLVTVNFTVVANAPGSGTPTGNVTVSDGVVSCTASVATGSCSLTPTSVGLKTLTATYSGDTNFNGSTDTESHSVIYAPGGTCLGSAGHAILQPVNVDGTSVFKQKSTVPAKFRVCDINGNSIGIPGVVSSFRLIQTAIGTAVSVVDEVVDSTTPDPNFRWDPTAQQWIFNMNTKSLQANTTYYYRITLNDSSVIDFMFGLK